MTEQEEFWPHLSLRERTLLALLERRQMTSGEVASRLGAKRPSVDDELRKLFNLGQTDKRQLAPAEGMSRRGLPKTHWLTDPGKRVAQALLRRQERLAEAAQQARGA